MAITIQSVFNQSDAPATPGSSASAKAAKPANPFAMFFANQMKSPALRSAAPTGSDSKLPAVAGAADSAAAVPAPDVAAMLAAGMVLPGQAAAAAPVATAADADALATAAAPATSPQLSDVDTVARARAQLQQAQAQLQLAQQQLQQAQALQQGEPAAAVSGPLVRQVQDAARLAAADPLAAPTATAGDAADVAFADQAAAVLRQLAGSRKSQSDSRVSQALQQVGNAVTSQTLPGPVAVTGNAPAPLTLKSEGLSAAIAARVSLRDEAAQQHKDESLQALPSSFAAVRQELPSTPATPAAVQVPGTMDRSKEWGEAFNQQIMNTVAKQLDQATFHVTPEKLGPIEISIAMNKDQAQITLTTSSAQARDIVESHLPALSKMMEHAGLHLADAQVSSQPQGQSQQQAAQQQAQQQAQQHAQQQGRRHEQPRFDLAALTEAEAIAPAQSSAAAGLSVAA